MKHKYLNKILIVLVIFYLSSLLLGYLEGTGIVVSYEYIVMVKPRKLNISDFQNAEAVFVSGTCYSREPFNGTMVFFKPPIVEGDVHCGLNMSRGGYVCSGSGYVYIWNFTCTDILTWEHPVTDHYYLGVPGDPIVVAVMNSYLADAIIIIAFFVTILFGTKVYPYGKKYYLALFFGPLVSYGMALTKSYEMDIMGVILQRKALYLLIGMYIGLIISPFVRLITLAIKKRFK
ncbi:MAG: hypothetical protein J7L82_02720 [Staphylothermus sp.]|nr:hypothetical protein [Staphylothermus sp.]